MTVVVTFMSRRCVHNLQIVHKKECTLRKHRTVMHKRTHMIHIVCPIPTKRPVCEACTISSALWAVAVLRKETWDIRQRYRMRWCDTRRGCGWHLFETTARHVCMHFYDDFLPFLWWFSSISIMIFFQCFYDDFLPMCPSHTCTDSRDLMTRRHSTPERLMSSV